MKFDIFFSICQTRVDGEMPDEAAMFSNFFSQVDLADTLGFGTAWLAESHLSCQTQKENPCAVIPQFEGEIGLNTDVLQLAHLLLARTSRLNVGSAIRNILCNGGPLAHAEAVRTFLTLQQASRPGDDRVLDLGFASGRFPFSNIPYGIRPRNPVEDAAWPVLKGMIFREATEIFLRCLRGDVFASSDITPKILKPPLFRDADAWQKVVKALSDKRLRHELAAGSYGSSPANGGVGWPDTRPAIEGSPGAPEAIRIPSTWFFDKVGVIPFEAPLENLRLTIGAHDAAIQDFANTLYPVGVFNLSITPAPTIEQTHERMSGTYHRDGGPWRRDLMPRTVLVFCDNDSAKAGEAAHKAVSNYWKAVEKTLDPAKVEAAVDNALVGTPDEIRKQLEERFHPDDRLMCWFDFNNHDTAAVEECMRLFMNQVAPEFRS